jgi:hypothetical protein
MVPLLKITTALAHRPLAAAAEPWYYVYLTERASLESGLLRRFSQQTMERKAIAVCILSLFFGFL